MKILNCKCKKLFWWNKNYFFLGTLAIILINLIIFFTGAKLPPRETNNNWQSVLNFKNLCYHFSSAFFHLNAQHCLLNSLCFLVVGCFVERKYGSISLLSLVFVFALFCECMVSANHYSGGGGIGYSGVNFAFYAFIIVDFIFNFKLLKEDKLTLILSFIVILLIYVACCFCGGTEEFTFKIYPYDLITNIGHYTSFLGGLIFTTFINLYKLKSFKELKI